MSDSGLSPSSKDSFKTKQVLEVEGKKYTYYSLKALEKVGGVFKDTAKLPYSMKVLLENLLRHENGVTVTKAHIEEFAGWLKERSSNKEIAYHPARVLMQDFTGVPAIVDLATMRDAIKDLGGDPKSINPLTTVDLVIDHSVAVDKSGTSTSYQENMDIEFSRNMERYQFLRWGQLAFDNFRVVPPGTGICHQVNLEYLGQVVWTKEQKGETVAYPDTLVGTDSHTTMVNGLSILGWGVGGIEAEAAMLGQAVTMLIPEVVGFKINGKLPEGATATDLVLTVTQMLRKKGVVGKFVEFYGPGLKDLSLADRATLANMAPEYGATCGFFPVDQETLDFLNNTGRDLHRIKLVEAYSKAQGLWCEASSSEPVFTSSLELDLKTVVPSLAGPSRPQDRVELKNAKEVFLKSLPETFKVENLNEEMEVDHEDYTLTHGDVVIAAITSCTNTSNPAVMLAAGLVAKKAREKGLTSKPWVKTSLAPGSQVVSDYFEKTGLQKYLDEMGFNLVGYGCTTCIGNSGPLNPKITTAVEKANLVVCSVLSGNRNFEGRISPEVKANFLASPPLVVAYAIAGSLKVDITTAPLGNDQQGKPVYLKDIWPSNQEVKDLLRTAVTREVYLAKYADVFKGPKEWQAIKVNKVMTYPWDKDSTYVKKAPYFDHMGKVPEKLTDVTNARVLAVLGDSVTTDHISPAGNISTKGPAGKYLVNRGIAQGDFNSYGARRGNHELMMRGTFANVRLRNEIGGGLIGGLTKHFPSMETLSIFEAAMKYISEDQPLVIFAGKEYGTGSSRDWAAKGTKLLGIRAVIAESFERIHRSNLVGMGVLPLEFPAGMTAKTLGLVGDEIVNIKGISALKPQMTIEVNIKFANGKTESFEARSRVDTLDEIDYFKNNGILHFVLRNLAKMKA